MSKPWDVSLAFSQFKASLIVVNDIVLTEEMLTLSVGRQLNPRFRIGVMAGAIVGGNLSDAVSGQHDVGKGVIGAVLLGWRVRLQEGSLPFVNGSGSLSASSTSTTPEGGGETSSLVATDVRFGLSAGYSWNRVSAYGAGRVFVGPVFWSNVDESGSDKHFVQVAAGMALALPRGTRLFGEWAFAGEKNVSLGLGAAF